MLVWHLRRVWANTTVRRQAALHLAPDTLELELYDSLGTLPLFNPDDEVEPLPASVHAMRGAVGRRDASLMACPECAHRISRAFKNLLDWLTRNREVPASGLIRISASRMAQTPLMTRFVSQRRIFRQFASCKFVY